MGTNPQIRSCWRRQHAQPLIEKSRLDEFQMLMSRRDRPMRRRMPVAIIEPVSNKEELRKELRGPDPHTTGRLPCTEKPPELFSPSVLELLC
jgi:hypothetical protein